MSITHEQAIALLKERAVLQRTVRPALDRIAEIESLLKEAPAPASP